MVTVSVGAEMEYIVEPLDFRKYFYTCVILAIVCLLTGLVAVSISGYAGVLETSIKGTGSMDVRHHTEGAADVAMAQNATVVYQSTVSGPGDGLGQNFSTSFMVFGAGGTRRDQYVVKGSGAGNKVEFRATQISGDFVGEGEIVLRIENDRESFESRIVLDSTTGEAVFQGRVKARDPVGRPSTVEETEAIGAFLIESYLLEEEPPETTENWLTFCSLINTELQSVAPGAYVAPDGYTLDEMGNLTIDQGCVTGRCPYVR